MADDEETKISENKEDENNLINFINEKKQNKKSVLYLSSNKKITRYSLILM